MGKTLMLVGAVILLFGVVLHFSSTYAISYKNPLDLIFKKGTTTVYFPIGTSIILSVVLSLIVYFFRK